MTKDAKKFCEDIESHQFHLCRFCEEGRKEMVACLSQRAEYKCDNCGAKAKFPTNVCDPAQLPEIEWPGDVPDNLNLDVHNR